MPNSLATPAIHHRQDYFTASGRDPSPGPIAVHKVVVDESGTHEGSQCLAVAACLGTSAHWNQYVRDWSPIAQRYAPKGYHATTGRSDDNAKLAGIVARWLDGGLAVTVRYDDFAAVVPHKYKSRYGSEYGHAIRYLAAHFYKHYVTPGHTTPWLKWVLEAGHANSGSADAFFKEMQAKRPDFGIWDYSWAGKSDITTHAADLVAHAAAASRDTAPHPLLETLEPKVRVFHVNRNMLAGMVEVGDDFHKKIRWRKVRRGGKK